MKSSQQPERGQAGLLLEVCLMKFRNEGSLERYLALNGVSSISEALNKKKTNQPCQTPSETPIQVAKPVVKTKPRNYSNPWDKELHLLVSWPNGKLEITDYDES